MAQRKKDPPPKLDINKMRAARTGLFGLIGEHKLVSEQNLPETEQRSMLGATARRSQKLMKRVRSALWTLDTAESKAAADELEQRDGEVEEVELFQGAMVTLARASGRTALVYRDWQWQLVTDQVTKVLALYAVEQAKDNPDPKIMAAGSIIEKALADEEDDRQQTIKAKDGARQEGSADADSLRARIQDLELALGSKDQVVLALKAKVTELEARLSPSPTPANKAIPNSRSTPR